MPSDTAGGSVGIVYLGPVNANQEYDRRHHPPARRRHQRRPPQRTRPVDLRRHVVVLSADSSQSNAFIGGSTAAKGRYVPGQSPTALKDIQPAGSGCPVRRRPSQFIPTPTDTYMPDGSGRACTAANGAVYTARWPTGAALLDARALLVTYTDVCVTSARRSPSKAGAS